MKYKNIVVAGVLLALLLAVGAVALLSGGEPEPEKPEEFTGKLQITEICAKNESIIADNSGKYRDYIELYAPEEAVNLKGFTLTDGRVTSEPLGDITIGAGEYRILFLSNETTGFALGASGGDTIQLKTPGGAIAAQANTTAMGDNQVMILVDGKYQVTEDATPNFPNTPEGLAAFRQGRVQDNPQIVISEVLISNKSALPDELGIYSDVVELHNVSAGSVYLGNYFLSDNKNLRFAYRLPDMILEADEYLVVFCDGENYISEEGIIHANFGLSRGESLYLTDTDGGYLEVACQSIGEDVSWQLSDSGEFAAGTPSLGFANTAEGVEQAVAQRTDYESPLIISEVVLSSSGMPYNGVISDFVEITNRSGKAVSTAGWYLSDGGDPYDYALPQITLQPGECLVIRCDTEGAGFGLSRGETVMLTGPDFRHAPLVTCVEGEAGQSISASGEGEEISYSFGPVSLGYENTEQGQESYLKDQQPKGLRISEVMTSNYSYLRGPYGAACDWIELYNAGSETIDLSAYTITDNAKYPAKFTLPQRTLAPGEYCVMILTQDSAKARSGYDVIPMELSSRGESVYLYRDGTVEDFVMIPELGVDEAYGRGSGSMFFSQLAKATPGYSNSETAAVSSDPVAVTAPGSYNGVEYLDVELSAPGTIYYTTNCNTPGRYAREYTGPIRITKTTVLRVVCYEEGKSRSNVVDLLYVLNENDTLSVVSIVIEPYQLWDPETGIYVDGPNYDPATDPYNGANFQQNWERPASLSLYEADGSGSFSIPCGLKIFGGYSRVNAKKSFACMFRKSYGQAHLDYPVFGEDSLPYYEALVLRAGGQEAFSSRIKDEVITSFVGDMLGIPVQDYRPVALYLNGEYWGLYFIREKINENYVSGHFGVDADDVDLANWDGSDSRQFTALKNYAQSNDLSIQENYEYIASQIDLENYTDFMIAQIWMNNKDPGNVKYFTAPGYQWTWILYDTDLAFVYPEENSLPVLLSTNLGYDITSRTFAVRLLRNPEYKDYFLRRMAWQMREIWTEENIIPYIDNLHEQVREDMKKDCQRWGTSYSAWENRVEALRNYVRNRNRYLLTYIQQRYELTDEQMVDYGFPVQ